MNKAEAAKLLELIRLAYPSAYRGFDDRRKLAAVHMWAASFPQVPYPIVEQCFQNYRLENRFPPTVAELAEYLRRLHLQAEDAMLIHRMLGNPEGENHYRKLMEATAYVPPLGMGEERQLPAPEGFPALTESDRFGML